MGWGGQPHLGGKGRIGSSTTGCGVEVLLPPRGRGVEWWMGSGATMAWQEQGMCPWHMAPSLHQQSIGCLERDARSLHHPPVGKTCGFLTAVPLLPSPWRRTLAMSPNRRTLAVGPSGRILLMVPVEGCWSWSQWEKDVGRGSQREDIGHGPSGRTTLTVLPTGAPSFCHGTRIVTRGHTADTMPFTSLHTQSMHSTWASPKVFTIHSR